MRLFTLPCLFTSCNLFCGFISIFFIFTEKYSAAAWLIVIAIAFDIMDGRVARLTRSSSKFGAELDSLADLVSFGVTPAILYFFVFLEGNTRYGIFIAFLFVLAGALRLARFNVEEHLSEFSGLPIPGAAFMVASLVIYGETFPVGILRIPDEIYPALLFLLAILMVSKLSFPSAKKPQAKTEKRRVKLILSLLLLLALLTEPAITFPILGLTYMLSGPVLHITALLARKSRRIKEHAEPLN
ncbi:MAG: CDP-diacylglycerol--serine O-phosphatidyltransferase [bacterium]|jgi:CDP-diacylglycerol--serine O-phosphatidyltransferase|nr:CDP-diacylglycerol--serine O-phosphatidyltransferase [bacterium]